MGTTENKFFERPTVNEADLIKKAENEVNILAENVKNKKWDEVCSSLDSSELHNLEITAKMSPEARENFQNVIAEIREVYPKERGEMNIWISLAIQKNLDRISNKI